MTEDLTPEEAIENMQEALIEFKRAGNALLIAWEVAMAGNPEKTVTIKNYPRELPSFDELMASINYKVEVGE